jgi:hypothetical protein
MAKESPLTAGPRFCEVQPLTIKPLFPAPLGVSPRNDLARSPKLFASSFVYSETVRIYFCIYSHSLLPQLADFPISKLVSSQRHRRL